MNKHIVNTEGQLVITYPMLGDYEIRLFISLEPKQVKQCLRLLLQKASKLGVWQRARIDRIVQHQHGIFIEACSEYGIWIPPLPPGVTAEAYYFYQDIEQVLLGKYLLPLNQNAHLWQSRTHKEMKKQLLEAVASGVIEVTTKETLHDGIMIWQEKPGEEYEYFDWRASEQSNREELDSFSWLGKRIQVVKDY